ncbi:MAG: hypothetical protein KC468_33325, partial [Myxococcales bacterium]|nr:hypothetical protein [Myxococcales bacterium]
MEASRSAASGTPEAERASLGVDSVCSCLYEDQRASTLHRDAPTAEFPRPLIHHGQQAAHYEEDKRVPRLD